MERTEFERLTGFYPPHDLYKAIEDAYMQQNGWDKQEFCAAYIENRDGLASRIQRDADMQSFTLSRQQAKYEELTDRQIKLLKSDIEGLKAKLDKELEWAPYEIKENCPQAFYERLAKTRDIKLMTQAEAKDYLFQVYGFSKEKVNVCCEVPKYEKNRHGVLRVVGHYDRDPLYFASDMNYIRFDCGCMGYEVVDGNLRFFCD